MLEHQAERLIPGLGGINFTHTWDSRIGSSDPIQDTRMITISGALTLELSRRNPFVRAIGALIGFNGHDQPQLGSPPHTLCSRAQEPHFSSAQGHWSLRQLQLCYSHICVWLGSLVIQVLL